MNRLNFSLRACFCNARWALKFAMRASALTIIGWLTITCVSSSAASAQSVVEQSKVQALLELPLKQVVGTIVVPIRINEKQTANCILDTGMPEGIFIIRKEIAARCDFRYLGSANVTGGGSGTKKARVANDVTLAAENLKWTKQRAIVLPEPGPLSHLGVDGVIGATIFLKCVVQLDFENKKVLLFEPDQFDSKSAGESFAVKNRDTKIYVDAKAKINGELVDLELLVDTGANRGLSINPSKTGSFKTPKPIISTHLGSGVGGSIMGSLGRVESLKLGSIEMTNVATGFPDRRGSDGDGTLGMDLMEKFLVTIDYSNNRIFLKPNKNFSVPTEHSMTGMSVMPNAQGEMMVTAVIPESPAAVAGIKKGDKILRVNGKELDITGFSAGEFDQPGRRMNVKLERRGELLELSFTTRRLR